MLLLRNAEYESRNTQSNTEENKELQTQIYVSGQCEVRVNFSFQ